MIIPDSFDSALNIAMSNGYLLIFIVMIIEGPMITTAAAFAASLGYFNIGIIFVLSLLGDVIGDILHYGAGRILRRTVIERLLIYFKVKKSTVRKLEKKIHFHLWKSMTLIKSTPPLSSPGLLLVGSVRTPFLKYLLISLATTLPLTIFYTGLGYYFGFAIKKVLEYFNLGRYLIFFVVVALVLIFLFYRFLFRRFLKKVVTQ